MSLDRHFDELLGDLAGFYRSWLIYLGLETGLIAALHDSPSGLTTTELSAAAACAQPGVEGWARAAFAHGLLDVGFVLGDPREDDLGPTADRFRIDADLANVLLDESRPEFLGGQFIFSVGASLDYTGMTDFLRTGRPSPDRTARFHRSVEKLNAQDTTLFFEQVLPALPDLAAQLVDAEVLDVGCGAAGWLLATADAYPGTRGVGVEFDPEWLARARERVHEAGHEDRIRIVEHDPASMEWRDTFDLAYFQDVVHELPEPEEALRSAWRSVRPGGLLLVFDWCLPTSWDEYRTPQGELLWGYQLDELYQGTSLLTRRGFGRLFAAAGIGTPQRIELDAGATVFALRKG